MKIIDSHVHLGLQEFSASSKSDIPFDLCNSVEETIFLMDQHQIEQAVILPVPHTLFDVKRSNEYIFNAYCSYPTRFIPFCRIDDELEQNLVKGFQGVKLHLLYEGVELKQLKKELQIIEDAGVPLILHALFKNKVEQVRQILKIAPNMTIILAHMGRGHLYTGEQVVQNALGLKAYPNVFMDTSTVGDIRSIINVCEILGYDRILYGSDYPFGRNVFKESYRYDYDVEQIRQALSPSQCEMVFHGNITGILQRNSSDSVQVRRVKKSNYNEIISLIDELDETDKKYLALSSKYSLIRQIIRSERHCYVAYLHGKIVGFLRESGRPEGYSLLEEIIVSPQFRNMGIAGTLLRYYHNAFPKNLAKTNAGNHAIIHLLNKNGYIAENPEAPRIINWSRNGSSGNEQG